LTNPTAITTIQMDAMRKIRFLFAILSAHKNLLCTICEGVVLI
jgi:hypothetical protein